MSRESGFTLVEVLLALTLFAVIMTLALGGFRFSATAWRAGTGAVDASEEIHAIRRVLHDWVGAAVVHLDSNEAAAQVVAGFSGQDQSLSFDTYRPPYPADGGRYHIQMELRADDIANTTLMLARVTMSDGVVTNNVAWETLAELPGVWRFSFLHKSEPGLWKSEWTSQGTLPNLVRLKPGALTSDWPPFFVTPVAGAPFVCVNRALDPNRMEPVTCRAL